MKKSAFIICMAFAAGVGTARSARAQTISVSCPEFFKDRHQAIACTEAVFSQTPYHFTLASFPPSNGFGLGLVLTKRIAGTTQSAREYLLNLSLTGAITTDKSWFTGGTLNWQPPLPYKNDSGVANGLQLGKLRTKSRLTIEASAWHRSVKTLYYYGEGSGSPNRKFVFAQDDTAFNTSVRMPLTRWLVSSGQFEVRGTSLPSTTDTPSVGSAFSENTAHGVSMQPVYLHRSVALETVFTPRVGSRFKELPSQDDPHFQSLLLFTLKNNFAYHWQTPTDGSPYAYRQFIYDGDQQMVVHEVLRNFFPADRHRVIHHICQSNKRTDECDFGQLDVRTRLVVTQTTGANQIPFYQEPTLGGTDVDSRLTLRGWDNYRFRGRDQALVQIEYGFPVYDPVGFFLFYDAGTVGASISDLAMTRFRQDAGPGVSVRLRGNVVAQTFYAFGAGHGGRWNYNFSKVF